MAETELDAFLGANSEPAPEPQPAPEPEPVEQEEHEEEAPEQAEADPDAVPDAKPGERAVPLSALEKVRQDWKEKAIRAEVERDEIRKQLEEVKRLSQQAQQPPAQPPQPIDPVQDPAGYHARIQQDLLNERLNISQAAAQREFGAEAVASAAEEFRQAMAQNPALQSQLYQQLDPYNWVMKQVEVMRLQREIGNDPAAYRAKLRAELEAEIAARGDAPLPPPVSPAAGRPPSLANVRSAAPRATGAYAGPTPLSELFPTR